MLNNAKILFQLFSRSVAIGLKVYRQLKVPGFADSTGTEKFTLLINDLFDILNTKVPPAGIRKGSPKIQVSIQYIYKTLETDMRVLHR